jgi:hypothetical protein
VLWLVWVWVWVWLWVWLLLLVRLLLLWLLLCLLGLGLRSWLIALQPLLSERIICLSSHIPIISDRTVKT